MPTALASSAITKGPTADALIALVPGISAMSKISNNSELNRLNIDGNGNREYFVVRSNFQTDKSGWKFWNYFVNTADKARDALTDLLFGATPATSAVEISRQHPSVACLTYSGLPSRTHRAFALASHSAQSDRPMRNDSSPAYRCEWALNVR